MALLSRQRKQLLLEGFCLLIPLWTLLFAINVVALVALAFSSQFLVPGTASYVIAVIDLVSVVVALVLLAGSIYVCRDEDRRGTEPMAPHER